MLFQQIKYFPSLNSLRFFAASFVLIGHAESLRAARKIEGNLHDYSFFNNGQNAVLFFFVLSGFLITYLLLKEQKVTNTISIKTFYLKRVRRIWPLYFLLVLIGCILQPMIIEWLHLPYKMPYTFQETWYYFVFFLPGIVNVLYGNHLLEPLWSIGVEEVFYLIWAPLVKFLKNHILTLLLSVIGIKLFLLALLDFLPEGSFNYIVVHLIRSMKFEAMAIGGLGAYLVFHKGKELVESKLFHTSIQVLVGGIVVWFLFNHKWIDDLTNFDKVFFGTTIKSIFFVYIILQCSMIPRKKRLLENRITNYLGEISYGIYMFHLLVATLLVDFFASKTIVNPLINGSVFYLTVFGITIAISALSKRYFESWFMKKQN
jgi:peptidoglycan/LPS O-acetylase OafA/YrhL